VVVLHADLLTEQILTRAFSSRTFVQLEPALLDRVSDAGAELAALAPEGKHEGCVDLLYLDAAVLDRFDAGGKLGSTCARRLALPNQTAFQPPTQRPGSHPKILMLVPSFLTVVAGLRPEQAGDVLLFYTALPLVVTVPAAVWLLSESPQSSP
jgi:hypothetical protein